MIKNQIRLPQGPLVPKAIEIKKTISEPMMRAAKKSAKNMRDSFLSATDGYVGEPYYLKKKSQKGTAVERNPLG
jgi:hypothetical protein